MGCHSPKHPRAPLWDLPILGPPYFRTSLFWDLPILGPPHFGTSLFWDLPILGPPYFRTSLFWDLPILGPPYFRTSPVELTGIKSAVMQIQVEGSAHFV